MALEHGNTLLPETFAIRVPVAGCLKIGDVIRNGEKIQPKKLDYIRFCGPQPTKDGNYPDHPDFAEQNKAKPRKVRVELFSDDPAVCLEISRVMANRGSVLCKGNGHDAYRRMNDKGQNDPVAEFRKCPEGTCGDNCPFAKGRQCKIHSSLRFRVPGATPLGYVWQFRSTAWNTAQDLLGSMAAIKELTGGTLARLPLDLTISEQRRKVNTPKGPINSTFWTVGLAFNGDELDLIEALERIQKIKDGYKRLNLDSVEAKIVAMQKTGAILSDLDDVDAERAFALEYFPDGEEGTDMTNLPNLENRPAGQTASATTAPAAAKPKADPKPKPEPKAEVKTEPAFESPIAMEVAYQAVYKASTFSDLRAAFSDCILSFSFYSQKNSKVSQAERLEASKQNVAGIMKNIEGMEEISGQDAAGEAMLSKVEQYADALRSNGVKLPEKPGAAAPAATPAATAPATATAPAAATKTYPHADLLQKVNASVQAAVDCASQDKMQLLKTADAMVKQLFLKHCDKPGLDLGNGRIEYDQSGCDAAYSGRRTKLTNEIKAKNLPQLASYEMLVRDLLQVILLDIADWSKA